mgnify:CR=1 FL=1
MYAHRVDSVERHLEATAHLDVVGASSVAEARLEDIYFHPLEEGHNILESLALISEVQYIDGWMLWCVMNS